MRHVVEGNLITPAGPYPINGLPPGNTDHPCAELRTVLQIFKLLEHGLEHRLSNVLGILDRELTFFERDGIDLEEEEF